MIGASHSMAEYNGVETASHIKDKLVEMNLLNETIYATGIAASQQSEPTKAGNYQPNRLLANVCKQHVTRSPFDIARMAQDIAGGLVGTLPSFADFENEETGPWLQKFLKTTETCSVENRRAMLRLIENITMGRNAVGDLTESLHGAGSPQAQRIQIARLADSKGQKAAAERIACGLSSKQL